jgi:hypothetical protein
MKARVFVIAILLTFEQTEGLQCVEDGHSIAILGQAGTGESFLVKEIAKRVLALPIVGVSCCGQVLGCGSRAQEWARKKDSCLTTKLAYLKGFEKMYLISLQ